MENVSVISSIISPVFVKAFISKNYKVKEELTSKILKTGINHVYLIEDTQNKYIWRIYHFNWRTRLEIEEELRFLTHLKEKKVSISYPLPDRQGNYIQEVNAPEGVRYGVLYSYAEGDKERNLSENIYQDMGRLMAEIHHHSIDFSIKRTTYDFQSLLVEPLEMLTPFFEKDNAEVAFMKKMQHLIINKFQITDQSQLKKGIVHLDIWYDNLNVKSEKVTLFDFDFCGRGWLVLDVAYSMMQLFHIETDKNVYESKLKAFKKGYQEKGDISQAELDLIPYAGAAMWIFYAGVQAIRYEDWSNFFYGKNYMERFISMLKTWLDYHKISY